ncbi:pyridine nucleotide-disulfide oxidoreductase domain-containing protein [Toxoplasma gondii TgCatPRC2]|uniref:monodehydroascorbate reductase (NADH) n=1 Tax=Toxoplasma gondii TgCatPRC2 TaxID=1130821 RepID=A0A151H2D2_TOXGO|nr:pyridine nucleotide-disulfide oxidoreductase domain-containing protein [Toxoplasma gondii TgCatPRC2]
MIDRIFSSTTASEFPPWVSPFSALDSVGVHQRTRSPVPRCRRAQAAFSVPLCQRVPIFLLFLWMSVSPAKMVSLSGTLNGEEALERQLLPPEGDSVQVQYLVVGGGVAAGYFFHYFAEPPPLQSGERSGTTASGEDVAGGFYKNALGNVSPEASCSMGAPGDPESQNIGSLSLDKTTEGTCDRAKMEVGESEAKSHTWGAERPPTEPTGPGRKTKKGGTNMPGAHKETAVRVAPYPPASHRTLSSRARSLPKLTQQEQGRKIRFLMVSAEDVLPYERPALSKGFLLGKTSFPNFNVAAGISGAIQDAQWYIDRGIRVLLNETVSSVDLANRAASLQNSQRTVYFDTLIVATGLRPVDFADLGMWSLRGVPSNIFTFRFAKEAIHTVDLVKQIKERSSAILNKALPDSDQSLGTADASKGSAVVIGSGFTGTEVAAALCQLGLKVILVTRSARLLSKIFSPELSEFYEKQFEQRRVTIIKNASVQNLVRDVDNDNRVSAVHVILSDGTSHVLQADFVVAAVGSRPVVDFLNWQLMLADECVGGGILVDQNLQAFPSRDVQIAAASAQKPHPEVFALGDVAAFPQTRNGGRPVRYEHVWNARSMAQFLAKHLRFLEQREEREKKTAGEACDLLQEAEQEESESAAALEAAEDGDPPRTDTPQKDSDSNESDAENHERDGGYQFLPIYYSRIFDFSWKFFGFSKGTPVLVNDFDRQISRKIVALWIEADHTVQGAFLEGGAPDEEELLRRAADAAIVVSPEAIQKAKDVAEVLKLIRLGVEQPLTHRSEPA